MPLTTEDRLAIADLIALHGHLFDEVELDRLDELFTYDVIYDVSDFGQESMQGIDAIRSGALALGDRNPVAHHVTNIVVTAMNDDSVSVRSKGLGVTRDGKIGSVTYIDTVDRTASGWRISRRLVRGRRHPLNGQGTTSIRFSSGSPTRSICCLSPDQTFQSRRRPGRIEGDDGVLGQALLVQRVVSQPFVQILTGDAIGEDHASYPRFLTP